MLKIYHCLTKQSIWPGEECECEIDAVTLGTQPYQRLDIWLGYIGCTRYNIFALLSIVFVPNANHYVSTGQAIYTFSFRAYLYAFFLAAVSLFLK